MRFLSKPSLGPADKRQRVLDYLSREIAAFGTTLGSERLVNDLSSDAEAIKSICEIVQQILEEKQTENEVALDLAHDMTRTLSFIANPEQFDRIVQLVDETRNVKTLVEEARACIAAYSDQDGFSIASSVSANYLSLGDQVMDLRARLKLFQQQSDRRIVIRYFVDPEGLDKELASPDSVKQFEELRPKNTSRDSPVHGCLDGTRRGILNEIREWMDDIDAPNILWLKGQAGVGKSAIASSIVNYLRRKRRLGSSFFFQGERATVLTPHALWHTVAFDLAQKYPRIKKNYLHELGSAYTTAQLPTVSLFNKVLEQPLTNIYIIPPGIVPVIVIDALDECAGLDRRLSQNLKDALSTLSKWSTLRPHFKIIVTSRDDDDIAHVLQDISQIIKIPSGLDAGNQSSEDINRFLTFRFEEMAARDASLDADWPGPQIILQLAAKAGGVFEWARVVSDFIACRDPVQCLSCIHEGPSNPGDLADLYSRLLRSLFPSPTDVIVDDFRAILGAIILAKEQQSMTSLACLLSLDRSRVEHICYQLDSILESEDKLRFKNQSFVDFIINQEAAPVAFHIDCVAEDRRLALACCRAMDNGLRFNICNLESSYIANPDVPDIKARIEQNISGPLRYACWYWADHLQAGYCDSEVLDAFQRFSQVNFLFWLEVMSLTTRMDAAASMIASLTNWMKKHCQNDRVMVDLHQFIKTFHIGIQRNVPHIYLSALPLSPKGSFISKWYMELYPGTLKVIEGGFQDWPTERQAARPWGGRGFLDSVHAFAFSLDGNWAASGSYDKLIRIWNMKTGELIVGPFKGHSASVECLAFSPNGHQLASGGGYYDYSIKIWDTTTGRLVAGPFKGLHNAVFSLAYSPNGRHVAYGSGDRMIHIWEVETGELVAESNTGSGAAQSIAYSAEGCRIAYVTNDSMIGIWNVENEELSVAPFCVRRSQRSCIAFSPDGTLIACGNSDSTIEIWNATNQELLVSLRTGASWVEAVAFSPDGTRLLSGSQDRSVRIWDVKTGEQIAGPFEGHVSSVIAVAFLHDNDHFVTGSLDKMVRLWNVKEDNKQSVSWITDAKVDSYWMRDANPKNHLFFLPTCLQEGLMRPNNTMVIGGGIVTKLDFGQFMHGESWSQCKAPSSPES